MLRALSLKRFSPFIKDIFITSCTSVVVSICNILLVRVISGGVGPEGLGVYTLVRRTALVLLPFTSLSISIGLARYVGLYTGEKRNIATIFLAAVIISSICGLTVCAILFPFSALLSKLVFNHEGKEIFFILILFMLIGENLYICLYSYYRGRQMMRHANTWNIMLSILSVIMIFFLIETKNLRHVILGIGILYFISLFGLLPIIKYSIRIANWKEFIPMTKKLLAYSIPRVPGGLALTGIFFFGVMASPYVGNIADAAYLSIGIWIFQMLIVATDSFGLVILPKASKFIGSNQEGYLQSKLESIYGFTLQIGLFTFIQLFITMDLIIFVWLGSEYAAAVPLARIIICAMVPFFFYTMMRNIIDAVEIRAVNTYNIYISLTITVISSFLLIKVGMGISALAVGFDAGMISLGILTYLFMKRRYNMRILTDNFYIVLLINILMGFCMYFIKFGIMSNQLNNKKFAIIVSLQLLCACLYLIFLKIIRVTWIRDFEERIAIK